MILTSFDPVADADARLLILGSMPGVRSLQAQQYYAHPRNGLWPILGAICGFDPALDYPQRLALVRRHGIALWDVLKHCQRRGSLDNAIKAGSRVPNDFETFFRDHPRIERVCFNGSEAQASFRRWVLDRMTLPTLRYVRLPSTSPAHASVSLQEKSAQWRAALAPMLAHASGSRSAPG